MKNLFLTIIALKISTLCIGQVDTIFSNNEKIPCNIKEITGEEVRYSYEGEDLINTLYKNAVQKIVMKSGRVQTFSETILYKKIETPDDFEKVTVTQIESDIKGLFRIGDVSSKAKGTTTLSNQERVKERAYRKIKMQASLMGANVIYLTNQRTEGNKYGGYFQSGSTAETNLTGISYNNILPSYDEFKKNIKEKSNFIAVYKTSLWSGSDDLGNLKVNIPFVISNISNENGIITIEGKLGTLKPSKYRLVSFNENSFNIFYEDKSTMYNYKINL